LRKITEQFKLLFFLFSVALLYAEALFSQVTLAPTLIILNEKNPNGDIFIKNSGNSRVEVSTEIFFGYFESDSTGEKQFIIKDSVNNPQSAAAWTFIFPKKFIISANDEKRMRIISRAPKDLPDGEYWARIKVFTSPVNQEDGHSAENETIRTKLGINFSFVIPLFFRKGQVKTGISILDVYEKKNKDNLEIFANLKREGEAAYRGNVILRILDSGEKIIEEKAHETVIYYNLLEKFSVSIRNFMPGIYLAEIELNTEKTGKEKNLQTDPVYKRIKFEMP
jgi:P pilus assembly chaperone PapD